MAQLITVTATYLRSDGVTPKTGWVSFCLSETMRDTVADLSYPRETVQVDLDASGHISISLVSTDDPVLSPTGVTYTVVEYVDQVPNAYSVNIPYNAAGHTIDLANLAPAGSTTVNYGVSLASFNAHVAATTGVHGITDTSKLATIDTAQSITGKKTFAVTGGDTGMVLDCTASSASPLRVKMNSPPNGNWTYSAEITSVGAFLTGAWITVSGTLAAGADGDGVHIPQPPTSAPYMIGAYSDVFGPAIVARALGTSQGSSNFAGMNDAGHYVFGVIDTAEIQLGDQSDQTKPPSSTNPLDVRIYRTGVGALRTNAALHVDGVISADSRIDANGGVAGFALYDGNLNRRLDWTTDTGPSTYKSFQVDSTNLAAHIFDTGNFLVGSGMKLISVRNNTNEYFYITKDGGLYQGGSTLGFYGTTPIAKQTGVAVTAAAIWTALNNLGLIAA